MRTFYENYNLQLFADGVSGEGAGDGNSAGVNEAADAGQPAGVTSAVTGQNSENKTRDLESLGVPKAEAEKYRAIKGIKTETAETQVTAAPKEEQAETGDARQAAAAETGKAGKTERLTWDELMKDPEYNRQMNETVRASKKQMQEKFKAIAPALELLGGMVGVDASDLSKLDFAALNKAILNKDSFYEEAAAASGDDLNAFKSKTRKELDLSARERELSSRENDFRAIITEATKRQHENKIASDAAALKKKFPGFDLATEMKNERFAAMISPGGGLSVEQAYYALHHREIEQALVEETAQKASRALANSVQAGRKIPVENGTASRASTPVGQKKYSEMTKEERAVFEANLKRGSLGNFV